MLALVQPFGLHSLGGGPRILRSLLAETSQPYLSVCTSMRRPDTFDEACEVHLPVRPYLGRIEGTRLGQPLSLLTMLSISRLTSRLRVLFEKRGITCVHAIPHGLDFWSAFEAAQSVGARYILNVHDDMTYNLHEGAYLNRAMARLADTWCEADARLVISEAMGQAYNARYGDRSYTVVTDGLMPFQVEPAPRRTPDGRLNIYFMGSVHVSYQHNFQSLLDALNLMVARHPGLSVRFIVRGSPPFAVDVGAVEMELRGWGTQEEVQQDLNEADLLYFPLPFEPDHDTFVRFSLSTKLVTYLGSGLPILYHGPSSAAAAHLLDDHGAGVLVCTDDADDVARRLSSLDVDELNSIVARALRLARSRFMVKEQRKRFWEAVDPSLQLRAGLPNHHNL